ncbi:type II toxin-antitoxin system Phd/YefM family antitoxin [Thiotrichales bacterium 19S9-12]|nr:type II toxin-antitoxin system Phd/YefM family antitoxin [Thiotrichales bacterium 19S9-11]MCF6811508.1 type II toxin-antitoxin system Phd/YefM family antitoxin [Thiotrichales bacterium 19S9-12]
MKSLNATQARQDIYNLIDQVNANHEPVQINGKRNNAILISEEDWRAINETLYLLSIKGMRESIKEGLEADVDDCEDSVDL